MLIGLCGALCAGKRSIADYLVNDQGFSILYLDQIPPAPPSARILHDETHSGAQSIGSSSSSSSSSASQGEEANAISEPRSFATAGELLDFVTKRWQRRWVTIDVRDDEFLEKLFRRPWFLLVSVDAPVMVRWQRFQERCRSLRKSAGTLDQFVSQCDTHLYDPTRGLAWVIDRADVRLINQVSTLHELHLMLKAANLADNVRLRPNWDHYFMKLAFLAAQRSNCMKRRVGCVLVRDKRVISTGYNGTPKNLKNCNEGGCGRCNTGSAAGADLSTCLCIHAEENALLEAGRERIGKGSILYCDTCPCLTCSVKITQVGISEVIYSEAYGMDEKVTRLLDHDVITADNLKSAKVFSDGGVLLRQLTMPPKGLLRFK